MHIGLFCSSSFALSKEIDWGVQSLRIKLIKIKGRSLNMHYQKRGNFSDFARVALRLFFFGIFLLCAVIGQRVLFRIHLI